MSDTPDLPPQSQASLSPPPESTAQLMAQKGIVALFDILGYQQFLAANPPQIAAERVLSFLLNLPQSGSAALKEFFGKVDQRLAEAVVPISRSIEWLVFSDTILLTCRLEGDSDSVGRQWLTFLAQCGILSRQMFEYGLPTRGVVATGTFFTKGSCFAGLPIVEAYNLLTQLDISLCVLSASAREQMREDVDALLDEPVAAVYDYLVPLKGMQEKKLLVMPMLTPSIFRLPGGDIRQYVNDAFRGHNKDLPRDAYQKMVNTEMLLRDQKSRGIAARKEAQHAAGAQPVAGK